MYEKILVPLDGSSTAEIALPYAEEIAAKLDAEIIVVSVSEITTSDISHLYHSYLDRTREQMQRQLRDWGARKESRVQSEVLVGRPASTILSHAAEKNVGLIVMASRGSSGQGPWLLGNIAAKVLRATDKPVLAIRTPAKDRALRERSLMKRILVPLDGSKMGEAAIPYAEALAQALETELVLFQVVEPLETRGVSHLDYGIIPAEETKRASLAYLDGVGKPLKEKRLRTSSVVVFGLPAEQIIDYAEANAIDLIAMSTHGRTGMGRWVFGSVTDTVLHIGDTAVLVVRPTKT
jgi:nucleotide-binding universal stress UspA family protein